MRPAADVLCISIVCSTMLLKQHSCIDAALGALLALALDTACLLYTSRCNVPISQRFFTVPENLLPAGSSMRFFSGAQSFPV